jgi:hypothetical protein
MDPLTIAGLASGGLNALGGIFGGGNKIPETPYDMQPMRRNAIGLQNYLLGFSPNFTPYQRQEGQPGNLGPTIGGANWPSAGPSRPQGKPPAQGGMPQQGGGQPLTPWGGVTPQTMGGGMMAGDPRLQMQFNDPTRGQPSINMGSTGGGFIPGSVPGGGFMGSQTGGPMRAPQMPGANVDPAQRQAYLQAQQQWDQQNNPGGMMTFGGPQAVPFGGRANAGQAPYGMQPGGGFSTQLPGTAPNNDMLGRMESVMGPLGTPTTALQQQSLGGISQYLNSDPYGQSNNWLSHAAGGQGYNEANQAFRNVGNQNYFGGAQNAFGQAGNAFGNVGNANYFGGAQKGFNELAGGNYFGGAEGAFNRLEGYNPFQPAQGALEGMFAQNPGQGMLAALQPVFERNLAAANQQGGRFGSANAIMRSRAVDDFNLLGAQALQRGTDQQIAAAGQYGQMGNSLIGARTAAGQGLLGVGQGQMSQQNAAAQGMLGIGQGRLAQDLGAAQGQLGVGQGMLGVGQGQLQQGMGVAQGLGGLAQSLQGDRLNAAGQMAQNQNAMFQNLQGGYDTGHRQAAQEAERQQQALAIYLAQLNAAMGTSYQGRG